MRYDLLFCSHLRNSICRCKWKINRFYSSISKRFIYIYKKKRSLKSFLQVPKAISNNLYNMQKFKFPNLCKIFKFVCAFSKILYFIKLYQSSKPLIFTHRKLKRELPPGTLALSRDIFGCCNRWNATYCSI